MASAAAISIFLGAFLLFLVQPMLGKMILPWFGGTPAVWTTCMLFFQVLLLAGYAYAAGLARWLKPSRQAALHLGLLLLSLCLLPVLPSDYWKPVDGQQPALRILLMLLVCVGGPYFLLSANSPLVQAWFAHAYPARSPYRLYALSNIGSLGALLAYPFLVEPLLKTVQQGWLWSAAFGAYVAVCAWISWYLIRTAKTNSATCPAAGAGQGMPIPTLPPNAKVKANQTEGATTAPATTAVRWSDRALWLLLPTLSSLMLLAVTNHLCQDVAVVPFLWILPLSLYLISLIICFDRDQWYRPVWFALGAILTILAASDLAYVRYLTAQSSEPMTRWTRLLRYDIRILVGVYLGLFFFSCMLCHGEVVRRRPHPARLTEFYLTIAAGGALGGLLVALVCPALFTTHLELRIGLVLCFLVALLVAWRELTRESSTAQSRNNSTRMKRLGPVSKRAAKAPTPDRSSLRSPWLLGSVASALMLVVLAAQWLDLDLTSSAQHYRNFYGTLTAREWYAEDDPLHGRALYHGSILHGYQFLNPESQNKPTTYYTEKSGVGRAITALQTRPVLKVGVVGLGIGTLASYARHQDTYRFYEINPLVIDLAETKFTFLKQCRGQVEMSPGDARLSLERESNQEFDLLVLDAFSGDSIPVHLLTVEAMQVYLRHLKPDGVIAIHISNRYLDLFPVVTSLGRHLQIEMASAMHDQVDGLHLSASEWMLLTHDRQFLEQDEFDFDRINASALGPFTPWTDDFNNLFQVLRVL